MKAIRVHGYNKPPVVDDVPEPQLSGPMDVIVKVGGAGICRTDLHILDGQLAEAMTPDLPYTIGHENAGWVQEVGSGVTNLSVGDTVILTPQASCGMCRKCRAGWDMHCTGGAYMPGFTNHDGGMAEYMRTSARSCVTLRPETEPADVAALADAGLTAYHAVRQALPRLVPGTTAVVQGCGGLGHIGIQCLRALTASRIIVVDRNADALELARTVGADETVLADGNHVEAVRDLTEDRGGDVVFDFVAEDGAENDAWAMTAQFGGNYIVGYGGELRIPTMEVVTGERTIVGNYVGHYNDLVELMALAETGKVTLHTKRYSLDAAPEAIEDVAQGRVRGRAIVVP